MSYRSLHKNNYEKLQSLKCLELIFTVAESQRQRGNMMCCVRWDGFTQPE